jgi:hypothetical protein
MEPDVQVFGPAFRTDMGMKVVKALQRKIPQKNVFNPDTILLVK